MQAPSAPYWPTLLVWAIMGCAAALSNDPPAPPPRPPAVVLPATARYVSVTEARQFLQEGKLGSIVDLRTPAEVTGNHHLPGARYVNFFAANFDESIQRLELNHGRPCLLYCALGGRAARAASNLDTLGFKEILVLEGGFEAWRRQGGELGE